LTPDDAKPYERSIDEPFNPCRTEITMAVIRIEPRKDERSAMFYIEVYNPADATAPFVTTEPRYMTAAAAENDVIAALAAMTNHPRPQ
jgi:hypothetical protein